MIGGYAINKCAYSHFDFGPIDSSKYAHLVI